MRTPHYIRILALTFGVLLLLLRPYLIYQMTGTRAFAQHPAKAWNLMQRLVKKKDDHHEQQADGAAVLAETASSGIHPVIRVLNKLFHLLHAAGKAAVIVPLLNAKSRLPAQQHLYRLTSCFLI